MAPEHTPARHELPDTLKTLHGMWTVVRTAGAKALLVRLSMFGCPQGWYRLSELRGEDHWRKRMGSSRAVPPTGALPTSRRHPTSTRLPR